MDLKGENILTQEHLQKSDKGVDICRILVPNTNRSLQETTKILPQLKFYNSRTERIQERKYFFMVSNE